MARIDLQKDPRPSGRPRWCGPFFQSLLKAQSMSIQYPGYILSDRALPCYMGGRAPTIARTSVVRYIWRRRHRFRASPAFQYRRTVFPGVFCAKISYIAFLRGALYHFLSEGASHTRDVYRRSPPVFSETFHEYFSLWLGTACHGLTE